MIQIGEKFILNEILSEDNRNVFKKESEKIAERNIKTRDSYGNLSKNLKKRTQQVYEGEAIELCIAEKYPSNFISMELKNHRILLPFLENHRMSDEWYKKTSRKEYQYTMEDLFDTHKGKVIEIKSFRQVENVVKTIFNYLDKIRRGIGRCDELWFFQKSGKDSEGTFHYILKFKVDRDDLSKMVDKTERKVLKFIKQLLWEHNIEHKELEIPAKSDYLASAKERKKFK